MGNLRSFAYALTTSVFLQACFLGNLGSEERLHDTVARFNDDLRWQRLDLAAAQVAPSFRNKFLSSRKEWGQKVQLADAEVIRMQMDTSRDKATSWVSLSWYLSDSTILRTTMLEQHWRRDRGSFIMTTEKVVGGDPNLIGHSLPL